jgi:hypothetical protein
MTCTVKILMIHRTNGVKNTKYQHLPKPKKISFKLLNISYLKMIDFIPKIVEKEVGNPKTRGGRYGQ